MGEEKLAGSNFHSFSSCADLDSQAKVLGSSSKKAGVTSAVSDESVAGDSGVYEAAEKRFRMRF